MNASLFGRPALPGGSGGGAGFKTGNFKRTGLGASGGGYGFRGAGGPDDADEGPADGTDDDSSYYSFRNSCIDSVLTRRRGIPITLSILYEAVARRLGVLCEPVNMPGHFVLVCRGLVGGGGFTGGAPLVFIDAFAGGALRSEADMRHQCTQLMGPAAMSIDIAGLAGERVAVAAVASRMLRNLLGIFRYYTRLSRSLSALH